MARDKIKTIRQLRKLSQAALGKAAGLTAAEISRIECGYRDMSATEAAALAKALSVSLVTISDQPEILVPAAPIGLAAAKLAPAATSNASASVRETAPPRISGNLDDPANFNELPDFAVLAPGALDPVTFRARLGQALVRASKVLHTSRVPAPVWRVWREFERKVQDQLRDAPASGNVP